MNNSCSYQRSSQANVERDINCDDKISPAGDILSAEVLVCKQLAKPIMVGIDL